MPVGTGVEQINLVANADLPDWAERHEKELRFQEAKRQHRRCEAARAGHLAIADDQLRAPAQKQFHNNRKFVASAVDKASKNQPKLQKDRLDVQSMLRGKLYITM